MSDWAGSCLVSCGKCILAPLIAPVYCIYDFCVEPDGNDDDKSVVDGGDSGWCHYLCYSVEGVISCCVSLIYPFFLCYGCLCADYDWVKCYKHVRCWDLTELGKCLFCPVIFPLYVLYDFFFTQDVDAASTNELDVDEGSSVFPVCCGYILYPIVIVVDCVSRCQHSSQTENHCIYVTSACIYNTVKVVLSPLLFSLYFCYDCTTTISEKSEKSAVIHSASIIAGLSEVEGEGIVPSTDPSSLKSVPSIAVGAKAPATSPNVGQYAYSCSNDFSDYSALEFSEKMLFDPVEVMGMEEGLLNGIDNPVGLDEPIRLRTVMKPYQDAYVCGDIVGEVQNLKSFTSGTTSIMSAYAENTNDVQEKTAESDIAIQGPENGAFNSGSVVRSVKSVVSVLSGDESNLSSDVPDNIHASNASKYSEAGSFNSYSPQSKMCMPVGDPYMKSMRNKDRVRQLCAIFKDGEESNTDVEVGANKSGYSSPKHKSPSSKSPSSKSPSSKSPSKSKGSRVAAGILLGYCPLTGAPIWSGSPVPPLNHSPTRIRTTTGSTVSSISGDHYS